MAALPTTTSRLVLCHSWYTQQESRSQAMFLIRWFLLPIIKPVLDNMRETELWLESECDKRINWTVVRPAGLTNSLRTDKEFKVELDQFHVSLAQLSAHYSINTIAIIQVSSGAGGAGRIARADVARFMLSCIKEEKYHQKGVAIAV